jgi:uncharacterized membrane protein YfcA
MGLLSGLLGIGGGVVLVPMLVLFVGTAQHLAQGVSLLVIIPASISGLLALRCGGLLNSKAVLWLAAGAVLGAVVSANFVTKLPDGLLKKLFGVFVIYAGAKMVMPRENTPAPAKK